MHPWNALLEQLRGVLEQPEAMSDFDIMKGRQEVLRRFGRPQDLLDFLTERGSVHPEEKNQVLLGLLTCAAREDSFKGTARTLLFIAMFPALDRVFKSLRRFVGETGDPEGRLTNDLYWAFHVEIEGWDFAARTRVAATLQLNIKRKVKKQYILESTPQEIAPHKEALVPAPVSDFPFADEDEIVSALQSMSRIKDQDLRLILGRFLHNKPFTELAAELGISEANARQRFHRTLARLRERNMPGS